LGGRNIRGTQSWPPCGEIEKREGSLVWRGFLYAVRGRNIDQGTSGEGAAGERERG